MTLEKAKALLEEEYKKAKQHLWVIDPISYALYQVWKMADAERKENAKKNS